MDNFKPSQMMLACGTLFDLDAPRSEDVHIDSFLYALSSQPRFAGHLPCYYTVGSHTAAMYSAARHLGEPSSVLKTILLHDCHEALTGDIPSPVKRLLQPAIGDLEKKIDEAIYARMAHLPTPNDRLRTKYYDNLMWRAELHIMQDVEWQWDEEDNKHIMAVLAAVQTVSHWCAFQVHTALETAVKDEFSKQETMQ